MGVKKERILKRDWEDFIKEFNKNNQLKSAVIVLKDKAIEGEWGRPFLGITYDSESRKVQVFFGGPEPDSAVHLVHEIDVPRAFWKIIDENGHIVGIQIQPKPGNPMAYITFESDDREESRARWIQELAYAIYLQRGMEHGDDQADWYAAESIVDEATAKFL